ncbi:amidase [Pseudarthrobacter sp. P1]|uniref:amidase n=1 Tax=Pseudarthrobacter sp. P1 TaxID=3418418 RepID=UPI003CFA9A5E
MERSSIGVVDTADAIRSGALSSVALVQECLSRADALDPLLGTYVTRFDAQALAGAHAVDDAVARGEEIGPLAGVPVGVKDFIATREGPTTGQSRVHDRSWHSCRDATVIARLRAAGAIIMGKTTMTEHAMGRPDPTQPYPIPRNPWDLDRWTGGSSTGTGNGIAAGLFPAGLGTDTPGSVRIPAAMCGVTGLKTTHGLVPMDGCLPAAPALDVIGPMARSARDCAMLLEVMAPESGSASWRQDLHGIRLGVPWSLVEDPAWGVDPCTLEAFRTATEVLEASGATVQDIAWPEFNAMFAATVVIML